MIEVKLKMQSAKREVYVDSTRSHCLVWAWNPGKVGEVVNENDEQSYTAEFF